MKYADLAKAKQQMLNVTHVATGMVVEFPAFIKQFSDAYDVQWDTTTVYGRMDPVKPYQRTGRTIQLSIDVLADSEQMAVKNFKEYSKFIKMLYPVYSAPLNEVGTSVQSARTIKAPPLLRIKLMNYIQSTKGGGLLGCISGLKFEPKFDMGHYSDNTGRIFPTAFDISFQFTPLHEEILGFKAESADTDGAQEFGSQQYPYSADDIANIFGGEE